MVQPMKYNFIEIGTSNFYTCIENADDTTYGISIEPILYYLNQLPEKPNVIKSSFAISKNNTTETLPIYYVPEDIIIENNLPIWLTGCNAVGDYHKQHIWMDIQHLVKIDEVQAVPISYIFEYYNVDECDYLKLDTEGSDSDIILHLIEYLKTKPKTMYPKRLNFETNVLTPIEKVDKAINACVELGYKIEHYTYGNDDSMLIYL